MKKTNYKLLNGMNIDKLLNGQENVIVSFEEYYNHFGAVKIEYLQSQKILNLFNSSDEIVANISIGKIANEQLKEKYKYLNSLELNNVLDFSILLNGFLGKDWLFVANEFSNRNT